MIGLNITDAGIPWPAEMTHYRVWDAGAAWCQIHVSPGTFDWTRLDELMGKAAGRHVTYVVGGCPRWLAKYPDNPHPAPWLGPGSNSMPHDMEQFAAFMRALLARYVGRIHAYEIWNEPQLADFLYPYTTAQCNALAEMTRRAKRLVDAIDPTALVLAAAVLPRETSGGMTKACRYLAAMKAKGWNVDAMTVHIYPEVGTGVHRWKSMLQDTVSTLGSMGAPPRLWITETAFGLLGPVIPDMLARRLIVETYASDGGRFVFWYAYHRPDLGGLNIDAGTAAWLQITMEG